MTPTPDALDRLADTLARHVGPEAGPGDVVIEHAALLNGTLRAELVQRITDRVSAATHHPAELRRRAAGRPLERLTDNELAALDRLSGILQHFRGLDALEDLCELAFREAEERAYFAARNASPLA